MVAAAGDPTSTQLAVGELQPSRLAKRAPKTKGRIGRAAAGIDETKDRVLTKGKRLVQTIRAKAAGTTGIGKAATKKVGKPSRNARPGRG